MFPLIFILLGLGAAVAMSRSPSPKSKRETVIRTDVKLPSSALVKLAKTDVKNVMLAPYRPADVKKILLLCRSIGLSATNSSYDDLWDDVSAGEPRPDSISAMGAGIVQQVDSLLGAKWRSEHDFAAAAVQIVVLEVFARLCGAIYIRPPMGSGSSFVDPPGWDGITPFTAGKNGTWVYVATGREITGKGQSRERIIALSAWLVGYFLATGAPLISPLQPPSFIDSHSVRSRGRNPNYAWGSTIKAQGWTHSNWKPVAQHSNGDVLYVWGDVRPAATVELRELILANVERTTEYRNGDKLPGDTLLVTMRNAQGSAAFMSTSNNILTTYEMVHAVHQLAKEDTVPGKLVEIAGEKVDAFAWTTQTIANWWSKILVQQQVATSALLNKTANALPGPGEVGRTIITVLSVAVAVAGLALGVAAAGGAFAATTSIFQAAQSGAQAATAWAKSIAAQAGTFVEGATSGIVSASTITGLLNFGIDALTHALQMLTCYSVLTVLKAGPLGDYFEGVDPEVYLEKAKSDLNAVGGAAASTGKAIAKQAENEAKAVAGKYAENALFSI